MAYPPPLDFRILWTWDYGTRWDDQFYFHGYGAVGRNDRRGYFLDDYLRMVDFAAEHGFNGIVVWGALRSYDDGEQQLRDLIGAARAKGVRILVGCGTHGYGGIYYDPRPSMMSSWRGHEASLATWLEKHPECRAVGADGKPYERHPFTQVACPSDPANLRFAVESIQWLMEEFEPGGAQIEVGDYATCHCDRCRARRAGRPEARFHLEDMVETYSAIVDAVAGVDAEAWVVCETYSSFAAPRSDETPGFGAAASEAQKGLLSSLPERSIVQWVADRALPPFATQEWPATADLPGPNNVARIHAGSQWCRDGIEGWGVRKIADLARRCRRSGVNGASIFGEESPASPPNEANYLAFSEFAGFGNPNPGCDLDLFFRQTLDPLFGGEGLALEWERIYIRGHFLRSVRKSHPAWKSRCMDPSVGGEADFEAIAASMSPVDRRKATMRLAAETHRIAATLSGEPCRRWAWLENWLWRAEYLHRTDGLI